jgi:hypothetical protein
MEGKREGSVKGAKHMWGRWVRLAGSGGGGIGLRLSDSSCNTKGELKQYDEADDGHVGEEA